eukprot:TRINITY_DN94923_c0_g1_i1.p1 TRINITY_DN94923_c0_g1~~TRINITY_DN94923_c0_g1_i1.p1  ORF type:complete len:315 (+),score=21.71 TRINITY_DN94923_c0_g1_i1:1-945(+)
MAAILSEARTIKFRVTFRHGDPPLEGVMKVSQKKFINEPQSEILGHAVDRLLEMNRVPPIAYVEIPLSWLQLAGDHMPVIYTEWLTAFVLEFEDVQHLIKPHPIDHKVIHVSLQLWLYDIHPMADTTLSVPEHVWKDWFQGNTVVPRAYAKAAPEISDLIVLDYVLANTDRSLHKNNFVVGGCVSHCKNGKHSPKNATVPAMFVHLDQGSSFYKDKPPPPHINPLTAPEGKDESSFCKFRKNTIKRLDYLRTHQTKAKNTHTLFLSLKEQIHPEIISHIRESMIQAAQRRLDALVHHVRWCVKKYGEDPVHYFD